jgi:chromosome segregation ATPase
LTLTSHKETPVESTGVGKQIGLPQEQLESLQERLKEAEKKKTNLEDMVCRQADELKQMQRQREEEMKALGSRLFVVYLVFYVLSVVTIFVDGGSSGSNALAKLVELAKRNREMTAELETKKSRVKQLNKQVNSLEGQVATLMSQTNSVSEQVKPTVVSTRSLSDLKTIEGLASHCKKLEDKLGRVTSKLTEMRNQCQQYKRDLKTTQMVGISEQTLYLVLSSLLVSV